MILTRRGWLSHDEVREGDETLGYNFELKRSEWTKIIRIGHLQNADVLRIGHKRWSAKVTPSHRWVIEKRTRPAEYDPVCPECGREFEISKGNALAVHMAKAHGKKPEYMRQNERMQDFVTTSELVHNDRLRLSAPADTDGSIDISMDEAALMGWIAGDGSIQEPKHRVAHTMWVFQSKPNRIEQIRDLLYRIEAPYSLYMDRPKGPNGWRRHSFRLQPGYGRDLLKRSRWQKGPELFVASLSTEQREAWLEAMIDAEGSKNMQPGYTKPRTVIYQRDGETQDAIKLAVYLNGYRPSVSAVVHTHERAKNWSPMAQIGLNKPYVSVGALTVELLEPQDVWCVTTEIGSWTAEQEGHIFLTGNSNASWGCH